MGQRHGGPTYSSSRHQPTQNPPNPKISNATPCEWSLAFGDRRASLKGREAQMAWRISDGEDSRVDGFLISSCRCFSGLCLQSSDCGRVAARSFPVGHSEPAEFHCQNRKPPQRQPLPIAGWMGGLDPCTDQLGALRPAPDELAQSRILCQGPEEGAQLRSPASGCLTQAGLVEKLDSWR